MSLVPTYSIMSDGRWYKDPVLAGPGWFICYDDDDPIELVITEKAYRSGVTPERIIEKLKLDAYVVSRKGMRAMRCFERRTFRMRDAVAFFLVVNAPPPAEYVTEHEGISDKPPSGDCVFYDYKRRVERRKR